MTYTVKEIFYTLQGEGFFSGRAAVFCRFTGCNLWSGHEYHRNLAVCQFCDTDFLGTDGEGGGKFKSAKSLADQIDKIWSQETNNQDSRFVVCTGGEPLLQLDNALVTELHRRHFFVAVETNGTQDAPSDVDWLTVSPKAGAQLLLERGNELKLVHPQNGVNPEAYEDLDFDNFYLQPMDGPQLESNTKRVIEFCRRNPIWKVSLQAHKLLDIP
tara:strand:- start:150 stop:791 length:642 start_codon:yes stop_codon:yes gene_type:complete